MTSKYILFIVWRNVLSSWSKTRNDVELNPFPKKKTNNIFFA